MKHLLNYFKQIITIILTISMVITSIPAHCAGRTMLAPPGEREVGKSIFKKDDRAQQIKVVNNDEFQNWLEKNIEKEWLDRLEDYQIEYLRDIFQKLHKAPSIKKILVFFPMRISIIAFIILTSLYFSKNPLPIIISLLTSVTIHELGHWFAGKTIQWLSSKNTYQKIKSISLGINISYSDPITIASCMITPSHEFSSSPKEEIWMKKGGYYANGIFALIAAFFLIVDYAPFGFIRILIKYWIIFNSVFFLSSKTHPDSKYIRAMKKSIKVLREVKNNYPNFYTIKSIENVSTENFFFLANNGIFLVAPQETWKDNSKNEPWEEAIVPYYAGSIVTAQCKENIDVKFELTGTLMKTKEKNKIFQYKDKLYALYRITDFPVELLPIPYRSLCKENGTENIRMLSDKLEAPMNLQSSH